VLDRPALLVGRAHDILAGGVDAGLGTHRTDHGDLAGLFGELGQITAKLEVGLGLDRTLGTLGVAGLRIQRVDVRHAADHLEPDDALGLAEAGQLVNVAVELVRFTRTGGEIGSRPVFNAGVQPLPGFHKPAAFVF